MASLDNQEILLCHKEILKTSGFLKQLLPSVITTDVVAGPDIDKGGFGNPNAV